MSIDAALGRLGNKSGVCTSSTRPTNPYEGQLIYETDTNRTLVYDNAAWLVVADNQVLSIDSANGRVGVNDTSPSYALDVTGDINATNLRISGTEYTNRLGSGSGNTYPWSANEELNASDLNSALGASWIYPTLASGWGQYGSGLPEVRYRINADTLEISGIASRTGGTTSGNTTIFTLPLGSRPSYYLAAICAGNDGGFKPVRITFPTNGAVQLDTTTPLPTNGFVWLTIRIPMS